MKIKSLLVLLSLLLLLTGCTQKANSPVNPRSPETPQPAQEATNSLPNGFVYVNQVIPEMFLDIRYCSENNFVGTAIDGYRAPAAILTRQAAAALQAADAELGQQGFGLKIFDGYRPQKAVDHFISWSQDINDQKTKSEYYPNIDKADLFNLGYIAKRSGHTRGSSVDVTIVDERTGEELDMGSKFDFLDPISGWNTTFITPEQAANRRILRRVMEKHGFKTITTEWWHWTLIEEPYPDRYFNFDVQ